MRSLHPCKCGDVKQPTFGPSALLNNSDTLPLPFVPTTEMMRGRFSNAASKAALERVAFYGSLLDRYC